MMKLFAFKRDDSGGIVLEAALVLPLFMMFVLAVLSFFKIAVAEVKLSMAVSECVKQVAAHMYPVEALVQEFGKTAQGQSISQFIDSVKQVRETIIQAEQFAEHYSVYIPEPLLSALQKERELRTKAEEVATEQYSELINVAFLPVFQLYAEQLPIDGEQSQITITQVHMPDFIQKDNAYFGLEAEYAFKLPIPFMNKTVKIKKRAYERVWIGS